MYFILTTDETVRISTPAYRAILIAPQETLIFRPTFPG